MFVDCACLIDSLFSLTRDWECSTKASEFWATSLEKGNKCFVFVPKVEKCSIFNRRPWFGSARIAHLWKLWEKRYSSSLKMVKETVRKNAASLKKVDASNQTSEIFATKMEMREKVLTFLTHKSKPRVVQTMLVLVKLLSGQYDSYPLTQLALVSKCLCKYYISMI